MSALIKPLGRRLFLTGAVVGTGADLTEDLLQSFTLPANTLQNVGDTLWIVAGGQLGATADTKTIRLRWGGVAGSLIYSQQGAGASQTSWTCEAWIMKTGPSAQSVILRGSTRQGSTWDNSYTSAFPDNSAQALVVTGQLGSNAVANSVTCQLFGVWLLK